MFSTLCDNQKVSSISKMEGHYITVLYNKLQIKLTILSMNYDAELI